MPAAAQPPAGATLLDRLADRILNLPRYGRLTMAALFALGLALLITPWVDALYLRYIFPWQNPDSSTFVRLLPSLITAAAGLAMFAAGWVLAVGAPGERPRRRTALIAYFFLGVFVLLLALAQVLTGLVGLAPV